MKKAIVLILSLTLLLGLAAFPADAAPSVANIQAFPFEDGVLITWTDTTCAWCEIVMVEEPFAEDVDFQTVLDSGIIADRTNNNHFWSAGFINEDTTFRSSGATFTNTPGKTYYFYVLGCDGANWALCGMVEYTVPGDPTLTVTTDGNQNTLTYTLVKGGKGTIYRYSTQAKAQAGGDDYDKKWEVTYGGDPVVDTVNKANSYYVLAEEFGGELVPQGGATAQNGVENLTVEMGRKTVTITFDNREGTQWSVVDLYTTVIDMSQEFTDPYRDNTDASNPDRLVGVDGITDSNGAVFSPGTLTMDGTTPTEAKTNGKLMPGQTYRLSFTSLLGQDEATGAYIWGGSDVVFTVPIVRESAIQHAQNGSDPTQGTGDADLILWAVLAAAGLAAVVFFSRKRALNR